MAANLMAVGNSFGDQTNHLVNRSRNPSEEDDDVVFIESIQPPLVSAPAIADQRNILTSSKMEKLQGTSCIIFPPSKDSTSQNRNISETIVIDDEEDIETDNGQKKISSSFFEWGLPGIKNTTKDLDFSASNLSRSKTKTGVGPFNPGRMNVAGDVFENGESAPHHSPDSWISQSASFPRNQKQPEVDSLSPVALLPKQIFQPSLQQQLIKPAKITCANCKNPLQKGQTAYQRKGSAHLFCSTTCLSSFSHKRAPRKRSAMCKKNAPTEKAAVVAQVDSSKYFPELCSPSSLSPFEDKQNLRKRVLNKSRCTICNKLTEIRHEVGINNVTHKLCSNHCFNKYRLANGLTMNCCEQCGEYMPSKGAGNDILMIEGQQKRFCCQSCVSEYKQCIVAPSLSKTSASDSSNKRQRRSIDLEVKQTVIKLHEGGKSVNAIARDLGMSHSTITTILKNKEKILRAVKGSAPLKATRLTKMREGPISYMETLLMTWIEDQTQKRIPLTTSAITAKARSLFEMLKEKAGPDYNIEFSASSGWYMRFKQRFSLHNVKMIETRSNKLLASENRKRSDKDERTLYGSLNTPLEKNDGTPGKKEKTSELQFSVECNTSKSLMKGDVNLPSSSMSTIEQLEQQKSEDSVVLSTDPGAWPRILSIKQWDSLAENDPPQSLVDKAVLLRGSGEDTHVSLGLHLDGAAANLQFPGNPTCLMKKCVKHVHTGDNQAKGALGATLVQVGPGAPLVKAGLAQKYLSTPELQDTASYKSSSAAAPGLGPNIPLGQGHTVAKEEGQKQPWGYRLGPQAANLQGHDGVQTKHGLWTPLTQAGKQRVITTNFFAVIIVVDVFPSGKLPHSTGNPNGPMDQVSLRNCLRIAGLDQLALLSTIPGSPSSCEAATRWASLLLHTPASRAADSVMKPW
ncbi:zinc finger MYM-type protein 5-like [Rhynchocyon petersi]